MTTGNLVEPEFVAHLFAPLDGPNAADALAGVRKLWDNCRGQLGLTQPIIDADLAADLPADPAAAPEGALAGLQDPAVQFQAVVRREHDVLNFSFAIAALDAVPRSRTGLAASAPAGWREFTRWWGKLGGETAELLGGAAIYLAKTPDPAAIDPRAEVPARADDADRWWESGFPLRDFAAWEITPGGTYASRRLVLLAAPDQDVELSGFAWSDGGTELPPLGRYLMHAAKVRYLARVHDDGRPLTRLRERIAGHLQDPAADLAVDQLELAGALEALRMMRRSVDIARDNMAGVLAEPLPADARLARWLSDRLADDAEYLDATRERAERAATVRHRRPAPPPTDPQVEYRVGFGVDVVSYSSRSTPRQREVQARVAGMVERVLAGLDVEVHETDRQPAGDGMMVVLPARVPAHLALPKLLHGWRTQLVADNAEHLTDRIRLRLSIGSGPFTAAAIGFSGQAIIEIGRLLDSDPLRKAVADQSAADVVALVADRLHKDVVREGYDGLTPDEFGRVEVKVKKFHEPAWLWTGGESRPSAEPPPLREVLIVHGPDEQVRAAVFGLVRALDLHPLDWEEMVGRTGKAAPFRDEVLNAGFAAGPGTLVVLTPGDVQGGGSDALLRAGRALALQPDRTILVEIGPVERIPDLDGRETVRIEVDSLDAQRVFQHKVAQRLRTVGYPVDTTGTDWLDPTRFAGLDAYR